MHRDGNRTQRVASAIQHQLAELIREHYPELGHKLLSITFLRVSPDLSFVDVYCSCLEGEDIEPMIAVLGEDAGRIRHQLARQSPMKKFPALRFHPDQVQDSSRRIEDLLRNSAHNT